MGEIKKKFDWNLNYFYLKYLIFLKQKLKK